MPRKVKKEILDEDDFTRSIEIYSSYKDRLDDWRKLSEKEQTRILKDVFRVQTSWECMSSTCNRTFVSAPGLQYHLVRCGIPKEPEKRIRKPYGKRKPRAEPSECTETPSGPLESSDDDESDTEKKPLSSEKRGLFKSAVDQFLSYRDKLDDWRKLSDREQNQILRRIFTLKKEPWHCLSTTCPVVLGTYTGLSYHMKRCGVPDKDRFEKCTICGEIMRKAALAIHKAEVHGQKCTFLPSTLKRSLRNISSANGSLGQESLDGGESGATDENQGLPQIKRRRTHVSFGKSSREQYVTCASTAYESFKKGAFAGSTDETTKPFVNIPRHSKWKPLDESEADTYLPYLTDSVRFSVDGLHNEGEIVSLERFKSLKTGRGFIAFCGSAVTAASWCPIEIDNNEPQDQYALVALNNDSTMSVGSDVQSHAFQLWKLTKDKSDFHLHYIIAHDYGMVTDIKWCPSGQWKPMESSSQIGAVAVTSSIGEVGIYLIPILQPEQSTEDKLKVYKPKAHVRLYCGADLMIYSIDWSPYKRHGEIVAALADGTIVMWHLEKQHNRNFLDEHGRLLPVICLDVADGPVRCVQWWSENKVMSAALDRQISLWDMDSGSCVARFPSYQIINFASVGSFFPAVIYSYDASLAVPSATVLDFVCSGTKLTMPVINAHSSVVWALAINPYSGEILTVDDSGQVCRSCPMILDGIFEPKRKRFLEEVAMKSIMVRDGEDEVYDYAEARRRCWLRFTYSNKLPSKSDTEKDFKEDGLSGKFPLGALFAVAWNLNKEFSRWCCYGGQNGLLHIQHFEDR